MAQVLAATAAPLQTDRPLLRNRTYLANLVGHSISIIGDGFHSVALGFWVLQATGSGTAMATIMAVKAIVSVLLGPIAGTVADRVDRRRLMMVMDIARLLLVGSMIPIIALPKAPFLLLVIISALIAASGTFAGPAFSASMINIVGKERIGQASGLNQMIWTAAQIIGPLAGGLVYATWGAKLSFGIDSASYLVSFLAVLAGGRFASPKRESAGPASFWGELKEGLMAIRGHGLIRSTLVLAPVINLFGSALGVLIPVLAVKVWLVNAQQFGLLEGSAPVGFLLGAAFIMAMQAKLKRRGLWIGGGLAVAGLTIAMVGNVGFYVALPISIASGIALAVVNVLFSIVLQQETPPELQGRVFGLLNAVAGAMGPIGMMLAGTLADAASPALLTTLSGLGIVLVAVLGLLGQKDLRQYN
ncbi:MAG TPA: MFS transporter [Symbiobacteriaceae bacterium]|nr:MFS transporter [Symbiobacteriaceae bacterium]